MFSFHELLILFMKSFVYQCGEKNWKEKYKYIFTGEDILKWFKEQIIEGGSEILERKDIIQLICDELHVEIFLYIIIDENNINIEIIKPEISTEYKQKMSILGKIIEEKVQFFAIAYE